MVDAKRCDVNGCGRYFRFGDAIHGERVDIGRASGAEDQATVWWEFKRVSTCDLMDVCPLCTRMAIRAIVASWGEEEELVREGAPGEYSAE